MKKYILNLIPVIVVFAMPWTHRLVTENIFMAVKNISYTTAQCWAFGISMIISLLWFMYLALRQK